MDIHSIINSPVPLVIESKDGAHMVRVNKAMFEEEMANNIIGNFVYLTLFCLFDENGNLIGAQTWDRNKKVGEDDEYYLPKRGE